MVPKGLAAAVLASAVKIAPNFPMAAAISNLLYTILIYSILGTVIAILAVERLGGGRVLSGWLYPSARGRL